MHQTTSARYAETSGETIIDRSLRETINKKGHVVSGRGAGVAELGQTRVNGGFMRGTQDPVPKGYVSSNLTPCTTLELRYSAIFEVL